jgi:hypothetical protein
MKYFITAAIIAILSFSSPLLTYAQEDTALAKRIELAKKMHEIKPARDQVEQAVQQVALQLPMSDRDTFTEEILAGIDFEALETLSVRSMAEVFSEGELNAMIVYYGSAEAKSISEKFPVYEELVQPKILEMLDASLMNLRAGRAQ